MRVDRQGRIHRILGEDESYTFCCPALGVNVVKLFVGRDLSWGALAGALGLMFLVSSALRGPLPEGPFSERVPVLAQYAGSFLAAALMGGFIVLVMWGFRRFRSQAYETPRRDLALAILLMAIVTFRPAHADVAPFSPFSLGYLPMLTQGPGPGENVG